MGKPGPCCYEVAGRGDHRWITGSTLTFRPYQHSGMIEMNGFPLSNTLPRLPDLRSVRCTVEKAVSV